MMEKKYSLLNNIMYFYRLKHRDDRLFIPRQIAYAAASVALPLITIYLPKLLLDCVERKLPPFTLVLWLGSFVLLAAILSYLAEGFKAGNYFRQNFFRTYLVGVFFGRYCRIPYEYTEKGEYQQRYRAAQEKLAGGDWSVTHVFYQTTPEILIQICRFAVYSTMIGLLHPAMVVFLCLLSGISLWMRKCEGRYLRRIQPERNRIYRQDVYLQKASRSSVAAKDIRIFNLQGWLGEKSAGLRTEQRNLSSAFSKKVMRRECIVHLLVAFRDLVAYAWLIGAVSAKKLGVGDFMLYFGAVSGFGDFVEGLLEGMQSLLQASDRAQTLREYDDFTKEFMQEEALQEPVLSALAASEIVFENVSFGYEEGKDILSHFSLTIAPGERVALVGENGAGKSTIVKLLTGLYCPREGRILVNGVDLQTIPRQERFRLFSAVFQETRLFPFRVGENLTMQPMERVDSKRAWTALEKAGLAEKLKARKVGLTDYMTKTVLEEGIELSGGERQRFFLARALYKDAPVLVLDEPTAALDPIAESQVYDAYAQLTEGKTALFISHRLASTQFSDRIILLERGKIRECGTHEELLRKQGAYATMFALQASYYRDKDGEECMLHG